MSFTWDAKGPKVLFLKDFVGDREEDGGDEINKNWWEVYLVECSGEKMLLYFIESFGKVEFGNKKILFSYRFVDCM